MARAQKKEKAEEKKNSTALSLNFLYLQCLRQKLILNKNVSVYFLEYHKNLMVWRADLFNGSDAQPYVFWVFLSDSSSHVSRAFQTVPFLSITSATKRFRFSRKDSNLMAGIVIL